MNLVLLLCTSIAFTGIKGEADKVVDIKKSTCSAEEDCDVTLGADDTKIDEKARYLAEKAKEYHFATKESATENLSDEQIKENIENIRDSIHKQRQAADDKLHEQVTRDDVSHRGADENNSEEPAKKSAKSPKRPALYQFPPLSRLDPVKVGYEVELELEEGKFYKRVTRAIHPPVFEVLDFLSAEECLEFVYAAGALGLQTSNLFGADIHDELNKTDYSDITRISDQTWVRKHNIPHIWDPMLKRLSAVIEMPVEFLQKSEPIQLVKYNPGGHYHAHIDTSDTGADENADLPCCFQTYCGNAENTAKWSKCCRLCRYMTVMYYLSDVQEGGETAFPLADMEEELYEERVTDMDQKNWFNLSKYCYNSSLVVTPRRGSAIIWYSHFIDEKTGYLGETDLRSHHGGCDIIKGTKWIANNFISAATYKDRLKPSVWA